MIKTSFDRVKTSVGRSFLFYRKVRPLKQKTLREEAHSWFCVKAR